MGSPPDGPGPPALTGRADLTGPAERVAEEGAAVWLVDVVGRIDHRAPLVGGPVAVCAAAYTRFVRHRGSALAGGLAYFGLLSLVPSLVSLGVLVALLVDPARFVADLRALLVDRPDIEAALDSMLDELAGTSDVSLATIGMTGLLSLAISLYAASRFVYVGRQVLDVALELEPTAPSMLSRLVAIGITLLAQIAIVVGVLVLALVPRVFQALGLPADLSLSVRLLTGPIAAALVYVLLTAAMRFGVQPRRVVGWWNVGALAGTVLIVGGTIGLQRYLAWSVTYSQVLAVLGGVVALVIWLYVVGVAIVGAAELEGVRIGIRRRDVPRPDVPTPG